MHYQYRISAAGESLATTDEWVTVAGGAAARSVTIDNLTNGSVYTFEMRAVTAAGNGTATNTFTGTPSAG